MFSDSFILCGSKPVYSRKTSTIIDQFGYVIRHNLLIRGEHYGFKDSYLHVCNSHLHNGLTTKSLYDFVDFYRSEKKYSINYLHYINLYKEFVRTPGVFVHFPNNNTELLHNILSKNNWEGTLPKQFRAGLSLLGPLIAKSIKPYLIGYSLSKKSQNSHLFNKNYLNPTIGPQLFHDLPTEAKLICFLHNKGLVDASLCCIGEKSENISIRPSSEFIPLLNSI